MNGAMPATSSSANSITGGASPTTTCTSSDSSPDDADATAAANHMPNPLAIAASTAVVSPLPTTSAVAGDFHPEFMFCGDCASCAPPPPVMFPAGATTRTRASGGVKGKNHNQRKRLGLVSGGGEQRSDSGNLEMTQTGNSRSTGTSTRRGPAHEESESLRTDMVEDVFAQEETQFHSDSDDSNDQHLRSTSHCSRIHVANLTAPGQALVIRSILEPLPGVTKLVTSLTDRTVTAHHDPLIVPVDKLVASLREMGYDATVRRDGAIDLVESSNPTGLCRSTLYVEGICCASEVPAVKSILKSIDRRGVAKVSINITTRTVYVDHDPFRIPADMLANALNRDAFAAKVKRDGGRNVVATRTKALQSKKQQQQQQQDNDPIGATALATNTEISALGIAQSKFVESTLYLPTLTTLDSVRKVERTMRRTYSRDQIRAFHPHMPSKTMKVEHDPNVVESPSVAALLITAGFDEASVVIDGAVENLALPEIADYDEEMCEEADAIEGRAWVGLHLNVILSGLCWFLSMLSIIDGLENLKYSGIASVVFGIPPVALKAWRTIRRRQFDANCMMVVAAFGALGLGEFDEAASVAFLFAVSEFLEARATRKARRALSAIISLRPDHANLINRTTGDVRIVPASQLPVGSCVSVRTGDKIPADGIVLEGTSTVDESSLTGESRPIPKEPESKVSGGSINLGNLLVVRTTTTVDDSAVSRLIRLVEEAQSNRSPTEKLVDSFAKAYTPIVVTAAFFMCTIPWIFGAEVGRYWTLNGLIIIVVACPCSITISTPICYAAGLAEMAQQGIIVKGGARLEALGNVKKVVFDKTGTLTQGQFAVVHLETVGKSMGRKQVLSLLLLLEVPSSHPLSVTLVDAAKKEGISAPIDSTLKDHSILKGEGISARVDNQNVYVGNVRLFERIGMYESLDITYRKSAESWSASGGTVGFIGVEGIGIVGMFCVADKVREEAKFVISSLINRGYDVMMLTGDSDGAAKAVGKEVGMPSESIHSHLMPEDKLHFIGSIRGMSGSRQPLMCGSKELVLMVGDGVNDAPALAVADVGVAMGEGAALAMEMSDVTLMDSNLIKLSHCINMGRKVIKTIRENIILSLLAKMVVVVLAFVGKMTLFWAIASDVGIMLVVTLNGMKLLSGKEGASIKSDREVPTTTRKKSGDRYNGIRPDDELPEGRVGGGRSLPLEGRETNLSDLDLV